MKLKNSKDRVFKQEEAREYLGVGRMKLDAFIFSGTLPSEKRGRSRLVRKSDIDKLIGNWERARDGLPIEDIEPLD